MGCYTLMHHLGYLVGTEKYNVLTKFLIFPIFYRQGRREYCWDRTNTLKVSYPPNWFRKKHNDMKKVWPTFRIPSPRYMFEDSKSKRRKDVKWHPLIIPFVKLNFYGSSHNNIGRVRVGFYLHNERVIYKRVKNSNSFCNR